MSSISNTSRPGYVYDAETDTWVPIGVGPHTHQQTDITNLTTDLAGKLSTSGGTVSGNLVVTGSVSAGNDFAAGKNKILNGDFGIWQRGAGSFTTSLAYTADRFLMQFSGTGTAQTVTREAFTAGTAPVTGYEGTYFARNVVTGGSGNSSLVVFVQKIEDVRVFAGQTVTLSFWAKAGSGTPSIGVDLYQNFGSGGSATVSITGTKVAVTTSWVRYTATFSLPSITGKTIQTNNHLGVRLWFSSGSDFNANNNSLGIQSGTFDVWGVQLEAGSVATPFSTATGNPASELAACQRYYYRHTPGATDAKVALGFAISTTSANLQCALPTQMRVIPTAVDYGSLNLFLPGVGTYAITGLALSGAAPLVGAINVTGATGLTQWRPYELSTSATTGYIGFSAEL